MWQWFHKLGSPKWFYGIANRLMPWLLAGGLIVLLAGLVWGLAFAPKDYLQGNSYRIIFIHVPAAFLAQSIYIMMAVAAVVTLVWRMKLADVFVKAIAPVGLVLTFLSLFTGAVWGKPTWGTWWVWDARLTSTLILWIIYVAYLMLRTQSDAGSMRARYAAVLGIVGFLNIPFIHFSVLWWRTFHPQPKVITNEGIGKGMDPTMLATLGISLCAFTLLYFLLMGVRVRQEKLKDEIDRLKREKLYSA